MTNQLSIQPAVKPHGLQAQPAPQARTSYISWIKNGIQSMVYGEEPIYANQDQQQAVETLTQPLSDPTALKSALHELLSIVKPYPQFQKAVELLKQKINTSALIFDAEETVEIKHAVHALAKQFPNDAFLKRLDGHLHTEAATQRLEASLELWRLYGELRDCTDEGARQILNNLSPNGYFLPAKATGYLKTLETPYALERFNLKEEQKQALLEAHTQIGAFIGGFTNKHAILKLLEDLQGFIYNPVIQLKAVPTLKEEPIQPEKQEINDNGSEPAPSIWQRAQNAYQSVQGLNVKQQVSDAITEATDSFSKNASPELESASKLLADLLYRLENFRNPAFAEHTRKLNELLPKLGKHDALDALAKLIQNPRPDRAALKIAAAASKAHIDQQISLQLGSGVKMTRAMLGEVRKTTDEMLDDFEHRMEKHVRRLCDAFGINLDDAGVTEEHLRTVAVADGLKKLLGQAPTDKDVQDALELLSGMIAAPDKFIRRQWTQREKEILLNLQSTLKAKKENPAPQVSAALEVLAPFTSSPMEKLLESLSSTAAELVAKTSSKAGAALSKQMSSQITFALDFMMTSAKSALMIEKNGVAALSDPKYKPIVDAIDHLIPQIRQAEQAGDVTAVSALMTSIVSQFKKLPPIYLYKFPLFIKSTNSKYSSSPFSPYADGIKKDKEALEKNQLAGSAPVDQESLKRQTNMSKKEFVRKSTHFAAIKAIYEIICGIVPSDKKFFHKLLDQAAAIAPANQKVFKDAIKGLFFHEIDKLQEAGRISFATSWFAKLCYRLALFIFEPMTDRAADRFVDYVRKLIINRDEEGFFDLQSQIVRNFNTMLGSLGDVYKNVDEKPLVPGSLVDKIKAEAQQKQYYMDFEPKEFYKRVTIEAADKFYPNVRLTQKLNQWTAKHVMLSNDRVWKKITNSVISVAISPVYLPLLATAWMIQTITNWFVLKYVVKRNLVNNEYLEKFLESGLDKVVIDNEYTHAVNTVIAEQLQEILDLMHQDYTNKVKREPKIKAGSKQEHLRNELTRLVTSLFEVIGKSKNITPDQLNAYLKDKKSISQIVTDGIEGHVIPETVNSIVKIVEASFNSIMNKDQLEQRLNHIFKAGIDSYKAGKKVTEEEFKEKQEEISRLSDQIMELTIREAVDKKFDFSIEPQKNEINAFMEHQRTSILELHDELKTLIGQLSHNLAGKNLDLAKTQLEQMISQSETFKINRSKELHRQSGKVELDNGVKDLFTDVSTTTANKLENVDKELRDMLAEIKKPDCNREKVSASFKTALDRLEEFKEWTHSNDLKSVNPIDFTFSQLGDLKAHMTQIARTCVKEKMDTILKFFQEPMIYSMVARDLVMKPFLKGELKLPA